MRKPLFAFALAAVFSFGAASSTYGQDVKPPTEPPKQEQKQEPPQDEPKKEEPKKDPKVEEYEKAIKDLKPIEGQFTFYQRKKDILIELPEDKLGKIFLFQATFNTGVSAAPVQAGDWVGGETVEAFRFDRNEDAVWLIRPNLKFRWDKDSPLSVASERSFPEAILGQFRIEATHPEKKLLLVNATQLFYGDVLRLNELMSGALSGQYMLDRDKSGVDQLRSFEDNSVVRMRLHYFSPRGAERNPLLILLGLVSQSHLEDSRSVPIRVTYNMWFRQETDYRPRLADPRVGYFTQDFFSVERFLKQDRTERYIMRHDLRKKDPGAALSEPVKPIVWYIDHSVPAKYREACKEGILRWNKAFEALGYKNAIIVKDAPDDPEWDHADGRYNVLRWAMSPDGAYAIAVPRIDPFTGEILSAGITVDANMLSFTLLEHQRMVAPSSRATERALSVLHRNAERTVDSDAYLWETPQEEAARLLSESFRGQGLHNHACLYGHGKRESYAFSWNALRPMATSLKISQEDYVKQFIADVVSHEMGHCLGLRHNFLGSTHLTVDQLADDSHTSQHGLASSVMDYTPVNIMAVLRGHGNFFAPTIGAYDMWAIRYGYSDIKADTPNGERYELSRIASLSSQPGLGFMTDENADAWNPYAVRFDNSSDPVTYSSKMLEAARRLRKYAIEQLPRPGQDYSERTNLILASITRSFREGRFAARFVGGINANRNFRTDQAGAPTLTPIDPKVQREAMRMITRECLSIRSIDLPVDVLNSLSMEPGSNSATSWTAPLRDMIGTQQTLLLSSLLSADRTDRISENQLKFGKRSDAYTLDEHFGILLAAIFSEIGQDQNISANRRDLQRFMVTAMIQQASAGQGQINNDVRTVATDALRRLRARMDQQVKKDGKIDGITASHLREMSDTIARFQDRQFTISR
jgi:hypothetical protein